MKNSKAFESRKEKKLRGVSRLKNWMTSETVKEVVGTNRSPEIPFARDTASLVVSLVHLNYLGNHNLEKRDHGKRKLQERVVGEIRERGVKACSLPFSLLVVPVDPCSSPFYLLFFLFFGRFLLLRRTCLLILTGYSYNDQFLPTHFRRSLRPCRFSNKSKSICKKF